MSDAAPNGGAEPRVLTPGVLNIGAQPDYRGALKFVGSNTYGPNVTINLPTVQVAPSAAIGFIADTYGLMEMTADVLADPATGIFGTLDHPDSTGAVPAITNYYIGTGVVSFAPAATPTTFADLGNVDLFELTPTIVRLDHWNHRVGIRRKDFAPITEQSWVCRFTMDEFAFKNLQMALLATVGP